MINQPLPSLIMPQRTYFFSSSIYEFLFIKFFLVLFSALPRGNFSILKYAPVQLEVEIVTESLQLPKRRNSYRRFLGGRRNSYRLAQQQLRIVKIVSKIVGIVTYFHKMQFSCIYLSIYLSIYLLTKAQKHTLTFLSKQLPVLSEWSA